jgi:hypothetical protein
MEKPREVLVIYRLKFKSKDDFEKATQTLTFGENIGKYIESLQTSFGLRKPQLNYPMIRPPEINICQDDLVIYICSFEFEQPRKDSPIKNIMTGEMAQTMPPFPYYYEPFLRATFGTVADMSITRGKSS